MAVVVDTPVVIGFLRGAQPDQGCLTSILRSGEGFLTAVTVFELGIGLRTGGRQERACLKLIDFLGVLPFHREAAKRAAELERRLREQGQTIGTRDVFIAGICLTHGLPLVTGDTGHFERVPGLRVITPARWRNDGR